MSEIAIAAITEIAPDIRSVPPSPEAEIGLCASMREHGQQEAVIVRVLGDGNYRMLHGRRRLRSAAPESGGASAQPCWQGAGLGADRRWLWGEQSMNGPDFTLPSWLCQVLLQILRARYSSILPPKPPHGFTIGGDEQPYLRRWFITPRGEGPAAYFHQFLRDDEDRALHDHPWPSLGVILGGGYIEHTPTGAVARCVGDVVLRRPEDRHRVELFRDAFGLPVPAWTLFLVGKRQRDWGFWCPGEGTGERFVPWQEFTQGEHGEVVGKGCDA